MEILNDADNNHFEWIWIFVAITSYFFCIQIRGGSCVKKPENIYTNPGSTEEEIHSFLKQRKINNIPGYVIV